MARNKYDDDFSNENVRDMQNERGNTGAGSIYAQKSIDDSIKAIQEANKLADFAKETVESVSVEAENTIRMLDELTARVSDKAKELQTSLSTLKTVCDELHCNQSWFHSQVSRITFNIADESYKNIRTKFNEDANNVREVLQKGIKEDSEEVLVELKRNSRTFLKQIFAEELKGRKLVWMRESQFWLCFVLVFVSVILALSAWIHDTSKTLFTVALILLLIVYLVWAWRVFETFSNKD